MDAHRHDFLIQDQGTAERRTRLVVWLTLAMMVVEIGVGTWSRSMALTADGWHMGSHAAALGMAAFAYAFARRHAQDARFTFGTGKVGPLAGYTSAVVLALIALLMAWESVQRLVHPVSVRYTEAILVAVVGLLVNLASALILGHDAHEDHTHDHNLRAAYLHVVADALTSVLAIVALVAGRFKGWTWLDPAMGLVGAAVISRWALGLMVGAGQVLLDAEAVEPLLARIRARVEASGARVLDLHVWRLGPACQGCILSLACPEGRDAAHYRQLLDDLGLAHLTVEVARG
jgi:cation diffusion facilitator family transporter